MASLFHIFTSLFCLVLPTLPSTPSTVFLTIDNRTSSRSQAFSIFTFQNWTYTESVLRCGQNTAQQIYYPQPVLFPFNRSVDNLHRIEPSITQQSQHFKEHVNNLHARRLMLKISFLVRDAYSVILCNGETAKTGSVLRC